MRSLLKAAALWQAAVAGAFYIPESNAENTPTLDVSTIAGSIGPDRVSIQFQSFCPGCFEGTDDGLDLELSISSSQEECTLRDLRLNGIPLIQSFNGEFTTGHASFSAKLSNGLDEREMYASWQTICMNGEASLLSVNVGPLQSQQDASDSTGFTVSFKQRDQPIVLRLQTKPLDLTSLQGPVEAWLHPDDAQRLIIVDVGVDVGPDSVLHEEYEKLEELKRQMFGLQKELHRQEGKIFHMLKQDFKTCTGMKCLLQTAVRKIPDFTQLVRTHFRHHPKPGSWQPDQIHFNCSRSPPMFDVDENEDGPAFATMESPPPPHDGEHAPPPPPPPPPPPSEGEHPHPHPPFDGPPPPWWGKDHPHPPFGDHPPFDKDHPHPPFGGPPPWFGKDHPEDHPPFDGEHPPSPPGVPGRHGPPPPFHSPHHRHHFKIVKGIVALVVLAIAVSFIFRRVRARTTLFRSARRSADRAARREERRTQRAYRSAARRHQWAQWWNRYRRPFSSADYDEKRELIIEQETVLEDAMQGDIRSLRTAHEIVGEMMRAEEGRARLYYQANLPPSQRQATPAELAAGVGSSTRSTLVESYVPPPPRYEEELEGDITVVDGFQYTPSASEETPDSSVVDCSPRLSFETGRTTLTKEPRD